MPTDPLTLLSLSRRLGRRAIDLLVVAFVILVGLSIGRQLMDWWRADPETGGPNLSGVTGNDFDWNRLPVKLQFGSASTAIERIPFRGGITQVEERLTTIGKAIVDSAELPRAAMLEAERDWLKLLQLAAPVLWDSDRGNVYRRQEPMPSFVATRFAVPDDDPSSPGDDAPAQRIVGWGLAFPKSPVDWTIYVFHPEAAPAIQSSSRSRFDLPAGSQNVTNLVSASGAEWHVFQGRGDVSSWVQHFDRQFAAATQLVRTVESEAASLKYRDQRYVTDIQIRRENEGQLTGVVWSAPLGEPQ